MENINKELLIEKFCAYVSAKRKQALYLKLFFVSATVIIVSVLFYAYSITKHASEQILVVSTGGQFLPTETMELDQLYKTLLAAHCYSVSYYVNSFNVNNIKNNQSRASFWLIRLILMPYMASTNMTRHIRTQSIKVWFINANLTKWKISGALITAACMRLSLRLFSVLWIISVQRSSRFGQKVRP